MPKDEAERERKRAKILAKGPTEEELKKGVEFRAKLIGKEEVPRPSGRGEVVKTMRRIRSDFKSRSSPKEPVIFCVSIHGLAVILMTKKTRIHRWQRSKEPLFEHSIQKVLYVSHDSQDLKVFSYIGRDSEAGPFFCAVFKAAKRSLAVQIVASVGLAFSVCEEPPPTLDLKKSPPSAEKRPLDRSPSPNASPSPLSASPASPPGSRRPPSRIRRMYATEDVEEEGHFMDPSDPSLRPTSPLAHHSLALARLALTQHTQEGEVASAALRFLKDRLASETAARAEAEGRVQALLAQNRALLVQLNELVMKMRVQEPAGAQAGHAVVHPGGHSVSSLGRHRSAENEALLSHRFFSLPSRNAGGVLAELAAATASSDGEDDSKFPEEESEKDGSGKDDASEDSLSRQLRQWLAMCGREGPPDVLTPLPRLDPPPASSRRRPPAVPPRQSSTTHAATPL